MVDIPEPWTTVSDSGNYDVFKSGETWKNRGQIAGSDVPEPWR